MFAYPLIRGLQFTPDCLFLTTPVTSQAYVIHPAFYEASASALAYEFLREVLRREPTDEVTLWALYTEAAGTVLDRPDAVPVPLFGTILHGKA
jgi:hypothetical protein